MLDAESKPALAGLNLETYLERLASTDAAPGGGAAVALTGAQAAALLAMVVRLSVGEHALLAPLDTARQRFLTLAQQDGEAFGRVLKAYKLPNATSEDKDQRRKTIQEAFRGAAEVPLEVMQLLSNLFTHAEAIMPWAKPTVVSDAAIAVQLMGAAIRACRNNITINLKYIKDVSYKRSTKDKMKSLLAGKKERRKDMLKKARAILKG